jgi:hypothetical protein
MGSDEKVRTSGEQARAEAPVLPTVNPELKGEPTPTVSLHPAVYVM